MIRKVLILALLLAVLSSCVQQVGENKTVSYPETAGQQQEPVASEQPTESLADAPVSPIFDPTETDTPQPVLPRSTATSGPEPTALGPDRFPAGMNPLTGLPVTDPADLALAPALVSITNFPTTARPQAGLSYSPYVFEMYIGEGMTRFLAIFYGDYPGKTEDGLVSLADDRIGPVRSGRLPYESLRMLYNGFLVMASASPNVKSNLSSFTNVWGSDAGDVNSAMIPVTTLKEIASANPNRLEENRLSGQMYDMNVPVNGQKGQGLWIPYNYLNQIIWRYDPASGAYLRFQDNADGQTFIQATDRLNEEPLTYENVVVLFANHQAQRETLIDINLMYVDKMPALLFRDGTMHEIYWTTANSDYEKSTGLVRPIRFIDAEGNPFPLKPGQTWVEIVQQYTAYNETVDSEIYIDLKRKREPGSGFWAIHFFPTVPER